MGASATLESSHIGEAPLAVDPGGRASATLRVRNNGETVDELSFQAMGAAAPWMEIEPPSISLPPGGEAEATIRFNPPRSPEVVPGETPFAVQVVSREDPDGSVAGEGTIVVGRYDQRIITLTPPGNIGRRTGKFEVTVDNRGNVPFRVSLTGYDTEHACRFLFDPPVADVGPGTARAVGLKVVAPKFWRGLPRTHQFEVQAIEDEQDPEVFTATFIQQESLPTWLLRALLAAALVIVLGVIAWFALIKPAVQDTARDTIAEPLASMNSRVDAALTTTTVRTTTTLQFATNLGTPTDFQLAGTVPVGNSQTFSKSFDKDFALFDFAVQNPDGASGTVQIMRGTEVLQVYALENIRDNAQHMVAPYVFDVGDTLVLKVVCTTAGSTDPTGCAINSSFSGFEQ
ncbi:MAG: hypothetical protein QM733_18895 [Ilumatobacteraceae bacterium]